MDKSTISSEIKSVIENNPIAIATITLQGLPNVIGVAYVKVVDKNQILITDNYMNQTVEDIKNNPNIAVVGWNKKMKGYKLLGKAKYFDKGEWVSKVKSLKENKGMPAKGAILITVYKIIESA